jgi:SAM-dependent methyltransferase
MQTFDHQWEEVHGGRAWGRYPSEDVIRFVARNRAQTSSEPVRALDAGCGTGPGLWLLAREGMAAYGFDGSDKAVASAQAFLRAEGVSASVSVCDAGALHYPSGFFDIVIDNGMVVANSATGVDAILKELHRVLKPRGKLLSTKLFTEKTTGFGSGQSIDERTFRNLEFGPISGIGTIHFFDEDEVRTVWKRAGFRNLVIDREFRTLNGGAEQVEFLVVESEKI